MNATVIPAPIERRIAGMVIRPCPPDASHHPSSRTGSLSHISAGTIAERLGFPPQRDVVPGVCSAEWLFLADGVACGVWDWKGSARYGGWSTSGPPEVFAALFGWRAGR